MKTIETGTTDLLAVVDDGVATLTMNRPERRNAMSGAMNQALGRVLHRPSFMPTPTFALRIVLGEVADVITTGQRVLPARGLELGYAFRFKDVDAALADLLGPKA